MLRVDGTKLRRARRAARVRAVDLADAVGRSRYVVYDVELGRCQPRPAYVEAWCRMLHITPADLVRELA